MPSGHYHLNPTFQPILLAGQSARLRRSNTSFVDVRVKAVYPLGMHRHDFGTISGDSLNLDDTHLDMDTGELAQYRYVVRGNFEVHLQHPAGVDQYRTNGSNRSNRTQAFRVGPLDWINEPGPAETQWMHSEFFVLEDETPRFDIYPFAPTTQAKEAYIDFYGIGYVLEKMPAGATGMVEIWVNGRPVGDSLT